MLAPPAFVSELMGLTVYQHIDGVLDDILADEPEARERVRALLREVMTDELATLASAATSSAPSDCAPRTSCGVDVPGLLPRHPGDETALQRRADGA